MCSLYLDGWNTKQIDGSRQKAFSNVSRSADTIHNLRPFVLAELEFSVFDLSSVFAKSHNSRPEMFTLYRVQIWPPSTDIVVSVPFKMCPVTPI